MAKGAARRVIVIDAPDPRFFEQAIFFLRSDAVQQGLSAEQLVEEASRIARQYTRRQRLCHLRPSLLPAAAWTLLGALSVGLVWFLS